MEQHPVRPEIALSWKRSLLSGVDPSATVAVDVQVEIDSRLLRAAAPVLEQVGQQIAGTGFCVLLADRDCRVVASVYADGTIRRAVERLGVFDGALLGEDSAGTNAVGTPLETGRSMVIHGDEHFLESFKGLSCYGHPVIHPVTGRVEGILDMTGVGAHANPLFAPFLARAASDIEARLLEGSKASERRLVDAFQRISHHKHVAVAAISDDFLLTNRTAMDVLDTEDHATLRELALDLGADGSRVVAVDLASGIRAKVKADRVAGADGGALFTVFADKKRSPIRRSEHSSRRQRYEHDVRLARTDAGALSISGEPGSGRTTAAAEVAGDGPVTWHNATSIAFDGVDDWTRRLVDAGREPGVIVVENVELVPETLLPILTDLVSTPRDGHRVVLTGAPMSHLPTATAALVSRCPSRLHLTPLRERRPEMAELARTILDDVAPGVRLAPSALDALASAHWPGNFAELKVVLTSAADARSSDRIDVADLPEDYRSSTRASRLGGREQAERTAIIDALKTCGGNKSHASMQLGISRSTLYARMRALDVTC
ncbi:Fis family transcriptional regulator [Rhodococcus sp. BP-252]|uniref:Fis family transcriptional regulator n=1 Tax=Rhodococcoides kyotonense TaxID=398843 RepID=A0A177Y9Z5_9NOCA|nr:Fis family transcriptional regulator [Rhodococcus sp. BP-320]MBY6418219.1 Fis family transcriptional regulator [Rhodococcus sp. BP-321]MBY6422633.1 Fis family transcriptional regulator [Rhodococcus sp. BP-324]MBY6428164.1 Fis family transcriptional regulator [Rhodococcus sp. BP-323]MBY6433342.1 Fis family transcriptional regulator [Rhodococcus sp. BP-322]MBY6442270.1 Fis family transcriptional regulator [Rhodococcus sp. BP-319]MBY6447137.1 Fis family transcriptional regulator [Rhodococcus 